MIVFSAFNGMTCGRIVLERLNIPVEKYYSSEIDKWAIQVTQDIYPDTIQLGDIENWREWDIDWPAINIAIAGSPCQGFSNAGKGLNFEDPRSKLFFVWIDILNHIKEANPEVIFLLENVIMKKAWQKIISDYMGLFPVQINAALVSAQNRDRLYWSNIRTKRVGLFNELYTDIPQPKDRGIVLKDILQPEGDIDKKYYLSDEQLKRLLKENPRINPDKSYSITPNSCTQSGGRSRQGTYIKLDKKLNPKAEQNKASCLTGGGHSGGNHSDMDIICVAMRGRNPENPSDREAGSPMEQRLEPNTSEKTNCLTSVAKDNMIFTKNYVQWDASGKGYKSQQDRAFYPEGKHGSLCAARADNKTGVYKDNTLRRLTPIECERLQGVPDNFTSSVSDSQRYKMLGNGWQCDVIEWILKFL